jgi:hypothetical protein
MSWFRKPKLPQGTVVIFDIGSASVVVVVATLKRGEPPRLHFTAQAELPFRSNFHYDRFTKEMVTAVRGLLAKVEEYLASREPRPRIEHVACVLSSVWYVSRTHLLNFERKEPFTVSPRFIQKMIERTKRHIGENHDPDQREREIWKPIVIEGRLLSAALNGYQTANPLGKKAQKVDFSLYTSFISNTLSDTLRQAIGEVFSDASLSFHSHALAMYTAVRDNCAVKGDFLLLDIGGEISDVTLVLDDILQESASFPIGVRTLVRDLREARDGTIADALSLLRMGSEVKSALNPESKEYALLKAAGDRWKKGFLHALETFSASSVYPRQVFVTAPPDTGGWFVNLLERREADQQEGRNRFVAVNLVPSRVKGLVQFDQGVHPSPAISFFSLHLANIEPL